MLINSVSFFILYTIYSFSFFNCVSSRNSREEIKNEKLPVCAACRTLTDSFKKGIDKTASGSFGGGDTSWEEENKKNYSSSEVRLTEIQEILCDDVVRGQAQCYMLKDEHEEIIENWWFTLQSTEPDIYAWLCIKTLGVCCLKNHYGPSCSPCKFLENDSVCSGNGRCKGDGTRKGNGECECNKGYEGEKCSECTIGFFPTFKNDKQILCDACHKSCDGPCSAAGPKSCEKCKSGWEWKEEKGCTDINECLTLGKSPCPENQFCSNTDGHYDCNKCDKACKSCLGKGPEMCNECSQGYEFKEGLCIEEKDEEEEAKDEEEEEMKEESETKTEL